LWQLLFFIFVHSSSSTKQHSTCTKLPGSLLYLVSMTDRRKVPPSLEEKPSIEDASLSATRGRRSSVATDKEARQGMLANDAGMAFVSEVDGMIEETTQCQVS
jgi:hypothetical protein